MVSFDIECQDSTISRAFEKWREYCLADTKPYSATLKCVTLSKKQQKWSNRRIKKAIKNGRITETMYTGVIPTSSIQESETTLSCNLTFEYDRLN